MQENVSRENWFSVDRLHILSTTDQKRLTLPLLLYIWMLFLMLSFLTKFIKPKDIAQNPWRQAPYHLGQPFMRQITTKI